MPRRTSSRNAGLLAALPAKAKLVLLLALSLIVAPLAVANALEYRSADLALGTSANAALTAMSEGGPYTVCDVDERVQTAPCIVTFTTMDQTAEIADTFYSVDGGPFVSGMLVTLQSGTHTVRFYSTDVAGTVESTKTVTITVK